VNLTRVADELNDAADKMAVVDPTTAGKLRASAAKFDQLETDGSVKKDVFPILDSIHAAVDKLLLKENLDGEARTLIANLTSSISTMLSDFSSLISTTIQDFTNAAFNLIRNGVRKFIERLSTDFAPCTPVWNVVTGVVNIPCALLIDPFNGYWFEIGGYVGVGVVAIILAVKIAGILRDEIQAEEEEDQIFDARNNHVTNHHHVPLSSKNQIGHHSPAHNGGGGGGRARGSYARQDDLVEIEMSERDRDRHPPPYAPNEGHYRSTDRIYSDYGNNKPFSYQDGHVNNGYRF